MKFVNSLLLLVIFFLGSLITTAQSPQPSNLSFKSLEGSTINLSDYQNRIVVLSFSAKGIPLMQIELTQLDRLAGKFANQGVAVLWISTNSNKQKNSNFASDAELRSLSNQY